MYYANTHGRKVIKDKEGHYMIKGQSGEIAEISATIKSLKDSGVVISITFPLNSMIWPMQR